jgi:hypothetical protein
MASPSAARQSSSTQPVTHRHHQRDQSTVLRLLAHLQVCVWCGLQLFGDSLPKRCQAVVKLLLKKLEQQVPRQQQLVVRQRIRVVLAALPVDLQENNMSYNKSCNMSGNIRRIAANAALPARHCR